MSRWKASCAFEGTRAAWAGTSSTGQSLGRHDQRHPRTYHSRAATYALHLQETLGLGPSGPGGAGGEVRSAAAGRLVAPKGRVAVAAESSSACDSAAIGSYKKSPEVKKLIGGQSQSTETASSGVAGCSPADFMPAGEAAFIVQLRAQRTPQPASGTGRTGVRWLSTSNLKP